LSLLWPEVTKRQVWYAQAVGETFGWSQFSMISEYCRVGVLPDRAVSNSSRKARSKGHVPRSSSWCSRHVGLRVPEGRFASSGRVDSESWRDANHLTGSCDITCLGNHCFGWIPDPPAARCGIGTREARGRVSRLRCSDVRRGLLRRQ
jgi:hypothetical protein